jgi:predicted small secreted protein
MRRLTVAVATLAVSLVLAGCGAIPGIGPDPRIEATPVATVTCPQTYEAGHAEAGLVPSDFATVAVLRCDPYASRDDDDGSWTGTRLERLEGDLEPVLAALASPSDPRSMGPCTAIGYLSPELWVEDADGRVVRVAVPSDGCGAPKSVGLDAALAALTVVDDTFTPESLVESAAAADAGCATQASMLVMAGLDAVSGIRADTDVPDDQVIGEDALIPYELPAWPEVAAVDGARVCDYVAGVGSTSSPEVTGGPNIFVGVREIATAEAQAVLAAARRAPEASSCTDAATSWVVVHPSLASGESQPFTVELDGCRRLVDPALQPRTAPPALLDLLTPPG